MCWIPKALPLLYWQCFDNWVDILVEIHSLSSYGEGRRPDLAEEAGTHLGELSHGKKIRSTEIVGLGSKPSDHMAQGDELNSKLEP